MGLLDRIRTTGITGEEAGDPAVWPAHLFRTTLAATAHRIATGDTPRAALADFLDEFQQRAPEQRDGAITDEPPLTGFPEWDALLAGVAEWLAGRHGLAVPAWTQQPDRFLDRMWFVSPTPGLRAGALVETPAALRRRGVFKPERSLLRV